MKTILHFISLLSVIALVTVTVAESLGVSPTSPLTCAVPFAAFIASILILTFREDYGRKNDRYEPRTTKTMLLPVSDVFAESRAKSPVHLTSWTARHRRIRRTVAHS